MTSNHDEILELAASAIDFELSPAEHETLSGHLRDCIACARRVAGLQADQRAIAQLPRHSLSQARADRIVQRIGRGGTRQVSSLRLVAIAAMLTLLALGALAVGAELLRRQEDPNLSVVPPVSTASRWWRHRSPSPVAVRVTTATPSPIPSARPTARDVRGGHGRRDRRRRAPRPDRADGRRRDLRQARTRCSGKERSCRSSTGQ